MMILYAECFFYKTFVIDADTESTDKLIDEIDNEYTLLLQRVNNGRKEDKRNTKKYYSQVRAYLKDVVNRTGDKLSKLA